jgi:NADH:ubiquinone oxidoreductase subunit 6 (subunit J)
VIGAAILGALAGITLAGGFGVVSTRNVVYAAVFLLMALMGVAGIFLLLLAEFLALVQVLIYGGAITIVLLFAIMLTRAPEQAHVEDNPQRVLAAIASLALFVLFVAAALFTPWNRADAGQDTTANFTTLSETLFSDYLVAFEIASLVLLVALVGAVVLTKSGRQGA